MTPSPQLSPSTLNERAKNQRGNNALEYLRSQGVSVVNETSFLERFTRLDNIARMQAPNSSEMTNRNREQQVELLKRTNEIAEGLANGKFVADELKAAVLFPLPSDFAIDDADGSQPATAIHPFEYLPIRFGPVLRDKDNSATGLSELRIPNGWTLVAQATTSDNPRLRNPANFADQLVTMHDANGRAICAATIAVSREGLRSFRFTPLPGGAQPALAFEPIAVDSMASSIAVSEHRGRPHNRFFGSRRRKTSPSQRDASESRSVSEPRAFTHDEAMHASHTSQRLLRGLAVVAALMENTQFADCLEASLRTNPISPALRDVLNSAGGRAMLAEAHKTPLTETLTALQRDPQTLRLAPASPALTL